MTTSQGSPGVAAGSTPRIAIGHLAADACRRPQPVSYLVVTQPTPNENTSSLASDRSEFERNTKTRASMKEFCAYVLIRTEPGFARRSWSWFRISPKWTKPETLRVPTT